MIYDDNNDIIKMIKIIIKIIINIIINTIYKK
jgi:hypothetical protein